MTEIAGYELQKKIKSNHKIDSYRALRANDKREVLIKFPHHNNVFSENLAILQHEYHLLDKFKSPKIIKALELIQDISCPALILEGIKGQLFSSYLLLHHLEMNDFFNLAFQLVEVISILHQHHIIHKQTNPFNFMIDSLKKKLTLIDLSSSTRLSEEKCDGLNLNEFSKEFAYISPEQTGRINRSIDYRTDFYSLGVMFYEMLTHRLPFPVEDPLELIHCHIAKEPPSIVLLRPDIPKMLVEIVNKLLNKMPEERYSSSLGLHYDLQLCRTKWENKEDEGQIVLGTRDIKDQITLSQNLYGREEQVAMLLDAFKQVSEGRKEIVFIAGYSGVGKTSLVKEVHKPIVHQKGHYIQGKFDQLQRSIPYSAIVVAFQHLVKQVLSESEERLREIKTRLLDALGNVGGVVIEVIPEVELIIGKQPPVPRLNPSDAQIRFNLVFQNFVRVFSQREHPLVIFLDDLQWADSSSLNFIENLLQDQETNYLLLLGAYRDNEVDKSHPLQLSINNLNTSKVNLRHLTLEPLLLQDTQQLLADSLCAPLKEMELLAECIFNKTQGNPFFINEFIRVLYEKEILYFSYKKNLWEWDVSRIQYQSATHNVIAFLTNKIHSLPQKTQEILKLSASLGHQFDFNTLQIIHEQSISLTAEQLYEAIQAHLIYPLEEIYKTHGLIGLKESASLRVPVLHYCFAHDRIQQASYELINENDRPKLHLKIAKLLLGERELEENDDRLFEIINHFNQSISLIREVKERVLLAKYNFWAGQKAKLSAAYDTAGQYLNAGLRLLDPKDWKENYELSFSLHKEFAVCQYLTGDFESADSIFTTLLQKASTVLDSLEIYRLKIEMLSTLGKHPEALQIGLTALRYFNIRIPENPNLFHVLKAIYKIKFQLRNIAIEDIQLPPMQDLKYKAIVNLITQLFNSAFIINQRLFILLTCKNISLSVKYGYTESTSMCIPVHAFVIMHSLNLYKEALSFIKLYNHLKEQYGPSKFEGKNQFVLGSFIEPYQLPIKSCNKTVLKAFHLCCEEGDIVYSNYSNLLLVVHAWVMAKNLSEVKKNIQSTVAFMLRTSISDFSTVVKFWEYTIQYLEAPQAIASLDRISFFEQEIIKGQNKTELSFFYSWLTRLYFLLGEDKKAIEAGLQHEFYSDYDKGLLSHLDGKFFLALALFRCLPLVEKAQQKKYLKKLKQLRLFIDKYASWAPENYQPYSLLLAAEQAQVKQEHEIVLALYEQTIEMALNKELTLLAAIASEEAGQYCQLANAVKASELYFLNAHRYFKEWGTLARVNHLEAIYPLLDEKKVDLSPSSQINHHNLDMLAVLKFTQIISSEIRLDKLLQKFLMIVSENAGAQRSMILTQWNDQWVIEAEGNLTQQVVYLNQLHTAELTCPLSILNYVQRTQKPIILNDAIQSELSFQDSYIQQENPRSLLMMPLFYKGHLSRILYLEHKTNSHTFTSNHLDSLQLLSAQAMTSLENAKLYYQATHDPLTGLANRNLLYEIFQQNSKQVNRTNTQIALLFIDLDNFKVINDSLGHDNGDKLLIQVANILTASLREGDVAARIGGDEFSILLINITSPAQVNAIIDRLFYELAKPIPMDKHLIKITASMGISIFPNDAQDIQTLLKLADTALYQAKEKGRNQYHYYSIELYQAHQRAYGLGIDLQRAYEKQEFLLMYQPFVSTTTGQIIGFESLLRWNHPKRGLLEASDFIHILERSPLIIPLSEWIIKTACQQAKTWQEKNLLFGSIAINVSAAQFTRNPLSSIIDSILTEMQLDPTAIELEITETLFIEYNEKLDQEIDSLKKMGISLVMDDFGMGYSGLSYLKHLPVQKIKIDKAFINNCQNDYLDQTIINAITTMAHNLQIKVIAEGVENERQLQLLQAQGVDGIQGYYYSKPLTAVDCERVLKEIPDENNVKMIN